MEICPINAVRPVPIVKRSPASPDLSRVFEIDYLGRPRDDEYTSTNRKAPRGLEDQEDDAMDESSDSPEQPDPGTHASQVNFFA